MFDLQIVNGPHRGTEVTIHESSLTLGRAPHCHLVLAKDHGVSRVHGELMISGQTTSYTDLQSHNGSRIRKKNGNLFTLSPLFSRCELEPGDLIFVGNTVIELKSAGDASTPFDPDLTIARTLTESRSVKSVTPSGTDDSSTADSLRQFLRLPQFDLTDVTKSKHALSQAFLSVFPQANCIAIVEITSPRKRDQLSPKDVLKDQIAICRRNDSSPNGFSFAVLAEAYQRKGIVSLQGKTHLPKTESVSELEISACMCGPVFDESKIVGFVQLIGTGLADFGSRDHEIFGILTSVTSLLLRQARVATERVKTRRLASVGQAVAALSHDVKSILGSVGSFASGLEQDIPGLQDNKKWQYIRQDLELMKFLVKDTRIRLSGTEALRASPICIADEVQPILDACQRYFIDEVDQERIRLYNRCDDEHTVFVHPDALWVALMNCVKNAIDAYKSLSDRKGNSSTPERTFGVRILSCDDPRQPDDYCLISICDRAGGIPPEVVPRMGRDLVSTRGDKGTGLGFQIVVDTVKRLGGGVLICTSVKPQGGLPAGTVISLKLPKRELSQTPDEFEDSPIVLHDVLPHLQLVYGARETTQWEN